MIDSLTERMNEVLPKITSPEFLSGKGLGNEIAFYIFDYPPDAELRIREFITFIQDHIPKHRPNLKVKHINLFALIISYLKDRGLLEKSFEKQKEKGDKALFNALQGVLKTEKLIQLFADECKPDDQDLVLISGVGSVWPLVRSHLLLNNLQVVMGKTPLIMFYPGRYDGQSLRLFGKTKSNNYYRAFKLVP